MEVMNDFRVNQPLNRKVLITGASGYIGGRLVCQLHSSNLAIRVMVRDERKISNRPWIHEVEVGIADAKDYASTEAALQGIHTAFYLLQSLNAGPNFAKLEEINARNFAKAAEAAGVKQIVYLGGIANDKKLSQHMKSRVNTGRILRERSVPVMEIRAGIIIGTGSASFEMLRHLVHTFAFITTPKWISNRTQPIAISDVLFYLSQAGELAEPVNGIFDIGGPDILSYSDLIQKFAKLAGLPKRWIIKLPFPSPALSGRLISLFTPLPTTLTRPLMGSLISEVVADPMKSLDGIINPPSSGLLQLSTAVTLALSNTIPQESESGWMGTNSELPPWVEAPSDPSWVGEKHDADLNPKVFRL